ncbi:MAG: hypothetical protein HYW79_01255 [Parcubacteria group bacterium]|nr:hypothetical protein [Parcubacteria group bacterium]
MQIISRLALFFVAIIVASCIQFSHSKKTEIVVKFEDGGSGKIVFVSQFSSLESKEIINEMTGISDSEGRIEFKELPVPAAYKISILKNGDKQQLVGYMFGKGASRYDHIITIKRDGGTSGVHKNKN